MTHIVLLQELLGIVIRVNVDLSQSVVNRRILTTSLNPRLEPRKDEFETVSCFDLVHKLVDGEVARNGGKQRLDGGLVAVDVE